MSSAAPKPEMQMPDWYFVIQMVYGIPMLILYVFMAIIMFSKPKVFSSSYFVITKAGMICDIALYVAYSAYYRFCGNAITGYWFESVEPGVFTKVIYITYYYTKVQRMGFILLLIINRGTAIIFPHSYAKFWDRYTYWTLLAVLVFPFFVIWTYFTAVVAYRPMVGEDLVFTMFGVVESGFPNITTVQHCLTLSLVVISAVINGFCISKLYRSRKLNIGTVIASGSQKKSELALFIISFTESLIETFEAILTVLISFSLFYWDNRLGAIGFRNNSFFVDLTIFSRPFLLFFGSKLVRKTILKFCRLDNSANSVTFITGKPSRSMAQTTTIVRTHTVSLR